VIIRAESAEWVRTRSDLVRSSVGTRGTTLRGLPSSGAFRGAKDRQVTQGPVCGSNMIGRYPVVASLGGAYAPDLVATTWSADPPRAAADGQAKQAMVAREVFGEEKSAVARAVDSYPDYATTRQDRSGHPGLRAGAGHALRSTTIGAWSERPLCPCGRGRLALRPAGDSCVASTRSIRMSLVLVDMRPVFPVGERVGSLQS